MFSSIVQLMNKLIVVKELKFLIEKYISAEFAPKCNFSREESPSTLIFTDYLRSLQSPLSITFVDKRNQYIVIYY
jgi:hypothetical protein